MMMTIGWQSKKKQERKGWEMKNFGYTKAFYTSHGQPSRQRGQSWAKVGIAPLGFWMASDGSVLLLPIPGLLQPPCSRLSLCHGQLGRDSETDKLPTTTFFTNVTVLRRHVLDGYDIPPLLDEHPPDVGRERGRQRKDAATTKTAISSRPFPSTTPQHHLFLIDPLETVLPTSASRSQMPATSWGAGHD
ncbi:hypothetical protein VTK26DRAFT_9042 [Humicola hyalothermophila]